MIVRGGSVFNSEVLIFIKENIIAEGRSGGRGCRLSMKISLLAVVEYVQHFSVYRYVCMYINIYVSPETELGAHPHRAELLGYLIFE